MSKKTYSFPSPVPEGPPPFRLAPLDPLADAADNARHGRMMFESTPMGNMGRLLFPNMEQFISPPIITIPAYGFEVLKIRARTTRWEDGFDLEWIWNVTSFDQFNAIRIAMETGDIGALREVAQANSAIDWRAVGSGMLFSLMVDPDAQGYVQQLAEVQP